ncbi:MAG: hypothetical protein KY434_02885 [Actinobacteria bacterium]|nr:hypothetical protein [Actinomycetota bacterium]
MAGFVTVQTVTAIGMSLALFVLLVNLVVFQYGRGVVRAAVDEGARAGSVAPAADTDCRRRADAVLSDLLSTAMRHGVQVRCTVAGGQMRATADVRFRGWLPLTPDWRFTSSAVAVKEAAP